MNCTENNHVSSLNTHCKYCKTNICHNCEDVHKEHYTIPIDQYQEELNGQSKAISNYLESYLKCLKERKLFNDSFFTKIKDKYEKQVEDVDKLFRDFHDQLHVKQVELKRELKSYYEENSEKYTICQSQLELDIASIDEKFKEMSRIDTTQFNVDQSRLITNYMENPIVDNKSKTFYELPTLDFEAIGNKFENRMTKIKIKSISKKACPIKFSEKLVFDDIPINKSQNLYLYNRTTGLEVLGLFDEFKVTQVQSSPAISPASLFPYWQTMSDQSLLYLIAGDKIAYLNNKKNDPTWIIKQVPQLCEYEFRSSISDNKGNIYMIGDKLGSGSWSNIYTMSIGNFEIKHIGTIKGYSNWQTLSFGSGSWLYICSGFKTNVLKFNIKTYQLESLGSLIPIVSTSLLNTSYSCYAGNLIFVISNIEPRFIEYNIKLNRSKILELDSKVIPCHNYNNLAKILYDHDQYIYYFVIGAKCISRYNILQNEWSIVHKTDKIISVTQYFSLS
ncbi:hypothetical protein DLAC_10233 [Tieghemostelium lacteum]|uniref:B box-type domain-containing protein n=1 Tax=Tieghemostelium lacteum TaxID=361077 RepID=A0A151Z4W6_TIELA|nr:hypothetical protein DLAC_10233 [Tieghemostelium lacteum]|eukprot:KYQ89013.1 hypothetical protein DLAC_10233 [Tieghemostelium lacteum]